MTPVQQAEQTLMDASKYHHVMALLRQSKMEHGTCQPRSRKACTACNAQEALDRLVAEYRGAPVRMWGGILR